MQLDHYLKSLCSAGGFFYVWPVRYPARVSMPQLSLLREAIT